MAIQWTTPVPVKRVRAEHTRAWRSREPHLLGWNAVPHDVWVYMLQDGTLVKQEWPQGAERPGLHTVWARPGQRRYDEKLDALERGTSWEELERERYMVVGGRPF